MRLLNEGFSFFLNNKFKVMSFFPCATKAKRKYHKFGLIDVFRERVKDKSKSSTNESSKSSKEELIKSHEIA